jgi:hypothetical protein
MQIIAHRGFWKTCEEKNSQLAFERAFENGFGVETDFRDCAGQIVISHDIPIGDEMTAEYFLSLYLKFPQAGELALNIKADGLATSFASLIKNIRPKKYFMFDMSVPDMLGYQREKLPFLIRISEFEAESPLLNDSEGIWLDMFNSDWYRMDLINYYLGLRKRVVIVSPELHQREYLSLWTRLHKQCDIHNDLISLCTDYPDRATEYFNA